MTYIALVGASLAAYGHPSECTNPVSGSIEGESTVTLGGTPLAAYGDSSMEFGPHAHVYDRDDGCISISSHSIQPDESGLSPSVTIGGNRVYLDGDGVATDPGSGGTVNMTDNGGNESVSITT